MNDLDIYREHGLVFINQTVSHYVCTDKDQLVAYIDKCGDGYRLKSPVGQDMLEESFESIEEAKLAIVEYQHRAIKTSLQKNVKDQLVEDLQQIRVKRSRKSLFQKLFQM